MDYRKVTNKKSLRQRKYRVSEKEIKNKIFERPCKQKINLLPFKHVLYTVNVNIKWPYVFEEYDYT